jgi:hypothetical protein
MWLTKFFTAVMAVLTGLLPSSCTKAKNPVAQQHTPAVAQQHATVSGVATSAKSSEPSGITESPNHKNLGELELTNHYETCVNLGAGKSCTIRPTLIGHSNLQLTMSLESKNADGGTKDLSVVQVVTKTGKPFEIAVGDMNFTLTPKLSAE